MMNGKDYTISALEKSVRFNLNKNQLHIMHVWAFAYHEARKSNFMSIAADRYRFNLRKQKLEELLLKIGFFSKQ